MQKIVKMLFLFESPQKNSKTSYKIGCLNGINSLKVYVYLKVYVKYLYPICFTIGENIFGTYLLRCVSVTQAMLL